ncbi:hypothetical protein PDE_01133 [Penicillium oxalicum 114-2]|uniref:Uncharacterized protein n=1 Tax=Penicillium oxalicum (strain 114-2 / CGMCC 5302) TaxID=933388 RepID=S8AWE5_PENO1|nr:hypothetical protein PDE_01133 [Penicillium oxalicum 114-2]
MPKLLKLVILRREESQIMWDIPRRNVQAGRFCRYKQIDHKGQHRNLVYKCPGQAQNAERVMGQYSETAINGSKAKRENAVTRLADSILKEVVCVLLWMTSFGTVDYGIEYGLGAMENATYDWFSVSPFSTLE